MTCIPCVDKMSAIQSGKTGLTIGASISNCNGRNILMVMFGVANQFEFERKVPYFLRIKTFHFEYYENSYYTIMALIAVFGG